MLFVWQIVSVDNRPIKLETFERTSINFVGRQSGLRLASKKAVDNEQILTPDVKALVIRGLSVTGFIMPDRC